MDSRRTKRNSVGRQTDLPQKLPKLPKPLLNVGLAAIPTAFEEQKKVEDIDPNAPKDPPWTIRAVSPDVQRVEKEASVLIDLALHNDDIAVNDALLMLLHPGWELVGIRRAFIVCLFRFPPVEEYVSSLEHQMQFMKDIKEFVRKNSRGLDQFFGRIQKVIMDILYEKCFPIKYQRVDAQSFSMQSELPILERAEVFGTGSECRELNLRLHLVCDYSDSSGHDERIMDQLETLGCISFEMQVRVTARVNVHPEPSNKRNVR